MSDSVQPHPWDSPGKNTGVGCHFLLQCIKVKSESQVAKSCRTLRDPMACSPPGSSIHGIFQARVLEWGAIAFSILPGLHRCKCGLICAEVYCKSDADLVEHCTIETLSSDLEKCIHVGGL